MVTVPTELRTDPPAKDIDPSVDIIDDCVPVIGIVVNVLDKLVTRELGNPIVPLLNPPVNTKTPEEG